MNRLQRGRVKREDAALVIFVLERTLFAAAFALGLWALLTAAQTHYYASLPIPAAPADTTRTLSLPGDAGTNPDASPRGPASGTVAQGDWVARLEAPSIGLRATVIEGSTDAMLARAAGHIEHTAFPGEPGNVGIAGHRDTTFRPVRDLERGALLRLTTSAGVFDYRVDRTFIVDPEDVYVLDPTDVPSLTLVTCYPFTFIGHAPKRYIVRATMVGSE